MASYRSLFRADSDSSRSVNSESSGRFSRLFSSPSSPASSAATSADDENDVTRLGDLLVRKDLILEHNNGAGFQSVQSFIDRELVHSEHTATLSYLIELCYAGYDKLRLCPSIVISTPDKKPSGKELIYNHLSKQKELKRLLKSHGLKLYVVFDNINQAGGPGTTAQYHRDAYLNLAFGANSLVGAQAAFPNVSQLGSTTSTCGVTWDVGGVDCLAASLHAWETAQRAAKEQTKASAGSLDDDEEECHDDGHALSMFSDDCDDGGSLSDSDDRISVTSGSSHSLSDLHGDHRRSSYAYDNSFDSPVSRIKETTTYRPSQRLPGTVKPIYTCPKTDIVLFKAREAAPTMNVRDLVCNTYNIHNGRKITKIHHDDPNTSFPVTIATHSGDVRGFMEPGKVLYRKGSRVYDMRAVRPEFSLGSGTSGANVFRGDELVGTLQVIRGNGTWCYVIPIEAQIAEMEEVCGVPIRLAGTSALSESMIGQSKQGTINSLPEPSSSSRPSSWSSAASSDDSPDPCGVGKDLDSAEEMTKDVSNISHSEFNGLKLATLAFSPSLSSSADLVRFSWDDYPLTCTLTIPLHVSVYGTLETALACIKVSFILATIGVGMLVANGEAETTAELVNTFTSILQSVGPIILGATILSAEYPSHLELRDLMWLLKNRRKELGLKELRPHLRRLSQLSARLPIDRGDRNDFQALSGHLDALYANLAFILRTLPTSIPMLLGDPVSFCWSLMYAVSARRTARQSLYLSTRSREFLIRHSLQDSGSLLSFYAKSIKDSYSPLIDIHHLSISSTGSDVKLLSRLFALLHISQRRRRKLLGAELSTDNPGSRFLSKQFPDMMADNFIRGNIPWPVLYGIIESYDSTWLSVIKVLVGLKVEDPRLGLTDGQRTVLRHFHILVNESICASAGPAWNDTRTDRHIVGIDIIAAQSFKEGETIVKQLKNRQRADDAGAEVYMIAVMGLTGVGKSTFVSSFTNESNALGRTRESMTPPVYVKNLENGLVVTDCPDSYEDDIKDVRKISTGDCCGGTCARACGCLCAACRGRMSVPYGKENATNYAGQGGHDQRPVGLHAITISPASDSLFLRDSFEGFFDSGYNSYGVLLPHASPLTRGNIKALELQCGGRYFHDKWLAQH